MAREGVRIRVIQAVLVVLTICFVFRHSIYEDRIIFNFIRDPLPRSGTTKYSEHDLKSSGNDVIAPSRTLRPIKTNINDQTKASRDVIVATSTLRANGSTSSDVTDKTSTLRANIVENSDIQDSANKVVIKDGSPNSLDNFATKMPDPCSKPRRNTGVEDLLCMRPPTFLKEYKNPCWMDGKTFRCLPYFHLIGNAKCGTTDFFNRMYLHPDIIPNNGYFEKEVWFWSWTRFRYRNVKGIRSPRMAFEMFTSYFQGPYIQNSPTINGYHYQVVGLGDPMDIYDRSGDENIPQNIPGAEELVWTTPFVVKHIQPDLKLLVMLRDPIERLYSHYYHSKLGTSPESFHNDTVISVNILKDCFALHSVRHCLFSHSTKEKIMTPLIASFDVIHLKEWTRAFPMEQIMILRNEDYSKDVRGTFIRVFQFLNISLPSEEILTQMVKMPRFRTTKLKQKAGPMLPQTKELLRKFLQPYVKELATFLNDDKYLFRDGNFGDKITYKKET